MEVPKYWGRVAAEIEDRKKNLYNLVAYRWSSVSMQDALAAAQRRLDELVARVQSGERLPSYGYGEATPLREPIVEELEHRGEIIGVITRNSYGALVLNAARAMFVDIDVSVPERKGGFLARLFGKGKPAPDPTLEVQQRIEEWARRNSRYGMRLYRTRAGLRVLFTSEVFDPTGTTEARIQEELGADPLYRRLCRAQKCFRARLTPKPWRVKMKNPPARWPFESQAHASRFETWQNKYDSAIQNFAVCALITTLNTEDVHPEVAPLLAIHDRWTKVGAEAPLA